ncbi:MAG: SPFH domain-containing protein [Anaerolineae bacterium]|nr:SPFH domain-containing protein [Anaerolineae bacterium]
MISDNNRNPFNFFLATVIDAILLMAFVSLALAAYTSAVAIEVYIRFALVWLVILLISILVFQVPRILIQYGQLFYNLKPDATFTLIKRLVMGPSQYPPQEPVLKIQDGKIVSEDDPVLTRIGGPGYLSVDQHNAVITQRLGVLSRVLGPGLHTLQAFEKIWDVVDLRPQRRTINVRFLTTEGIPAYVDAEVVFRIPFVDEYARMKTLTGSSPVPLTDDDHSHQIHRTNFSANAVLGVVTDKTVSGVHSGSTIVDWATYVPEIIVEGTVRDILERYSLGDFLYPQYWLSLKTVVSPDGQIEHKLVRPQPPENHQDHIEDKVKFLAARKGIYVEYVALGPILPVEDAISREWLEIWQAKLHGVVYQHTLNINVDAVQNSERAALGMLVDLITNTVQKIQGLADSELQVPPELAVLSFVGALQSLSERDPDIQRLMNRNADKLTSIITAVQKSDPLPEDLQAFSSN